MYGSGRGQAPFELALCGLSQKTKRLIRIAWFPRATLRATQYVVPGDMSIFFVFFMQPRFLCTQRVRTLTAPPTRSPGEPPTSTMCAPGACHGMVGSGRCCLVRSASASFIFLRCASPPGSACAALRAILRPARAPRGSTCGPRRAGGPSGHWGSTRTCPAAASPHGWARVMG